MWHCSKNFTLKGNYSFEQSLSGKSTWSVTISLLAAGQKVSLVIFLINKLGHRGQLDICRALINGACRWRDKNKLFSSEFLIVQKGSDIGREPKWWSWEGKWHFALTLSLAECWHNGTLRKSDGGGSGPISAPVISPCLPAPFSSNPKRLLLSFYLACEPERGDLRSEISGWV